MDIRKLVNENVNGATFVAVDTLTPVNLKGGKKNPFQGRVMKRVLGSNVMVFQNKRTNGYENMVERRLIQEGKDPSSFQLSPRQWGIRIDNEPFVTHNDNLYLEVIFLSCGDVTYLVDGVETNPDIIDGLARDKEEGKQGGLDNKVIIRTYNVANVKAITINKQRYLL